MNARISALFLVLALAVTGPAAAQERFGTLQGRVTDQQDAAVPGVTVSVTSLSTGEVRTFVTDANGQFIAADLNPGRYKVSFQLAGFTPVERPDVSVVLGRTFEVNTQMQVGGVSEQVQVTAEASPLVDNRSTLIAHNVSAEEFDRLPKARSFQSIAITAPSVNSGEVEGGFQVNGASGAENGFTVDGITTNSLINGQSRQNTVFEYLQEVQVKTSGISAEYGGALGGVISAVTKNGGNVMRGEGHYYFEGSALATGPVKRLVLEPTNEHSAFFVQDNENTTRQNEFGGSIGGPIIANKLFFFGSYSPRVENRDVLYHFTDASDTFNNEIWRQQAFGKLTYAHRRLTANWSTLWTPTKSDGSVFGYTGATPNSSSTALASFEPNRVRGYEINQVNTSGTADIHLTPSSYLGFRGGYFHDRYSDTGIPQTTNYRYGAAATAELGIPPHLQGPRDFENTPRALITDFDTTKRANFNVDYNHYFNALGTHTVRGGYGFQHVVNDINSYYPGGYVDLVFGRSFTFGGVTTGTGQYGYYGVNDRRITNKAGSDIHSLYVQDQWTLGNRLTLNLGIRTEDESIPDFRPEANGADAIKFSMADKIAPRLGAAYDVWGNGRMKVFGSWGLYYDWTKYELPRGSFGAETWCTYYRALDTLDFGSLNLNNMPGRDLWVTPGTCRDRRFQAEVDPDLKPMRQSSTSGGVEYQLTRNTVLTAHYIHNDLLETIEDIGFLTPTGDEGYVIGNPGRGLSALQYPTGGTPEGFATPRPKRQYDALELGFNRRFSNRWFFSANYTLSRLYGNYAGLASSDEITTPTTGGSSATAQQQAGSIARPGGNTNRAWDLDELLWDSHGNVGLLGHLATDRPHVVKLYGAYDLPFGTQLGAFFYGGSGTPVYTYVTSTNSADLFVEGREGYWENGQVTHGKRTPALYRTDFLVSHDLALPGGQKRLRFELNVLNVFNQKTARHIFNYLNKGAIIPDRQSSFIDLADTDLSQGYNYISLFNATTDGVDAYDPRYGMGDLFEPGRRAYVTVKFLF
jgi:Carboxypeptidase regulatory-like domain/TonB dependent receptor-like, beta-barrel/TonB-dependent Receptor Plug Domain